MIKIAADAMGGDNSPKKVVDGIINHHLKNDDVYYKIFGNEQEINKYINNKIKKISLKL